jgi:FkbM family methyltransferase
MSQLLFDLTHSRHEVVARLANRVRNAVVRRHNPDVRWSFTGRTLTVPLSHDLPWALRYFPNYAGNLLRIAAFLRRRDGGLRLADVGANVGDSYVTTRPQAGDRFLLVEGAERYFRLLERNVGGDPGVICVRALLSDRASAEAGSMVVEGGNAIVVTGAAGAGSAFDTLDAVLHRHADLAPLNLIKVDVEGYDGRVLRGARATLSADAPVVLFEHHPRLVRLAGDDDCALFGELAALGYGPMIVYDNRGFLLGTLEPGDVASVAELVSYARQQDGYYYDILAFPSRRAADRDAFLREERAFYATLEGSTGEQAPRA